MPPVIVDTSALLAFFDASEPDYDAVSEVLGVADALVASPYVVAELDYLVATRHGVDDELAVLDELAVDDELAVLDELAGGAWDLAAFDDDGLRRTRQVTASYRDQAIGVADASIVVLAERYRTRTIASLDRRHFGVVRSLDGGSFEVLPRVGRRGGGHCSLGRGCSGYQRSRSRTG